MAQPYFMCGAHFLCKAYFIFAPANSSSYKKRGNALYDVIIVGAGPAGLTAAIYAQRASKTVLVLEAKDWGG